MEKEMFELDAQNLDEVAGGKIIEIKDDKFLNLTDNVPVIDSAKAAEKFKPKFQHGHKHHGCKPHDHKHCGNKNPHE